MAEQNPKKKNPPLHNRATIPKAAGTPKFWNFNAQGEKSAELTLYGDIASYESWWSDEITPKQFADELAGLGDVDDLTVRLNSGGGDVFAAVAIFTRLKSHKAKVTVIIDGWAASAATIIAMAGDVVKIPAAASFMIHDPALGLLGYYGEDDLQTFAAQLGVCKDCIINAYMTKSGKTKEELAELMSATTWYTGEQAVAEGFCDEVLFQEAGEDGGKPIITDLTRYENMPQAFMSGTAPPPEDKAPQTNKEEREPMEIKNAQELRAAYPDFVKEIENAAVIAERKRIKDIEDSTVPGFEDAATAAKFEKPAAAADFAMSLVAAIKKQGTDAMKNREADAQESGVNNVGAEPQDGFNKKTSESDAALDRYIKNKKGGAK